MKTKNSTTKKQKLSREEMYGEVYNDTTYSDIYTPVYDDDRITFLDEEDSVIFNDEEELIDLLDETGVLIDESINRMPPLPPGHA